MKISYIFLFYFVLLTTQSLSADFRTLLKNLTQKIA